LKTKKVIQNEPLKNLKTWPKKNGMKMHKSILVLMVLNCILIAQVELSVDKPFLSDSLLIKEIDNIDEIIDRCDSLYDYGNEIGIIRNPCCNDFLQNSNIEAMDDKQFKYYMFLTEKCNNFRLSFNFPDTFCSKKKSIDDMSERYKVYYEEMDDFCEEQKEMMLDRVTPVCNTPLLIREPKSGTTLIGVGVTGLLLGIILLPAGLTIIAGNDVENEGGGATVSASLPTGGFKGLGRELLGYICLVGGIEFMVGGSITLAKGYKYEKLLTLHKGYLKEKGIR
jgi:hypothetical protein